MGDFVAPDGRIFFTERTGNLRVIGNGTILAQPVAIIPVAKAGEGGLLGHALDPDFERTHFIYFYYTYYEISVTDGTSIYTF